MSDSVELNERRAAVLFTDMEGSTEVSNAEGDARAMQLMRIHDLAVRKAAANHGGEVVKSTGDGYLVAFEEIGASVAAALDIRAALADHNGAAPDDEVLVRIGVHEGPVIAERGDLYGLAVNVAARITAKASSGQVLVSEHVARDISGEGLSIVDEGLFWLKGLRERWRLFEIDDGRAPLRSSGLSKQTLPLVGRDRERSILRQKVDAANEGSGGLTFLTGVTGSGKTRLAEEIGAEATARGFHHVSGRCFEQSSDSAYAPIVEIFQALRREVGADVFREALGASGLEIARMFPQLQAGETFHQPGDWPVQETRTALFTAIVDTLSRLAAVRPLVIRIDDLQWADEATLRLIEAVSPAIVDVPVFVLAIYNDEEVSSRSAFRPFLTALHRRAPVDRVALGPLTVDDVGALLDHVSPPGVTVAAPLKGRLHEATGGNPFFVGEMLRHLDGLGDAMRWDSPDALDEIALPDSLRLAVEERLSHLSEPGRDVVTLAALVAGDVGFGVLERLTDLGEDALLDALDEAERARVIDAASDGSTGEVVFRFSHGLFRSVLTSGMTLTRRQRLHIRVADALEAEYADRLDARASDLAHHLLAAGRWAPPERTLRFLTMAADRSLDTAAYEEALTHLDRASRLVPADDTGGRATVLERLGIAERSLGHLDDALALWDEALDAYEQAGRNGDVARLALTAAVQVAWWRRGDEVMALVDRGLACLGEEDSPLRAGFLALAGGVASQAGSYDQASRLLDDAGVIARRHGDHAVLGLTLYSQAVHHYSYYQYQNVVDVGRASVEHLRRAGDLWNLANVQGYIGSSLGWLGRFEEATEVGLEAQEFARRLGNWSAVVFADGAVAFRDIGQNPAADVLAARGADAVQRGRELGFPWLTSLGHGRLGLAAFWRGHWEAALENVTEAAESERRGASGGHLGRLFLLHAYLGNAEHSLELLEEVSGQMPIVGRPNSGTSWTLGLAALETRLMLGHWAEAARLYPVVLDHAAHGPIMRSWDYRLVSTLAGAAAACAGESEAAALHFQQARDLARSLPMLHEEPEACRFEAMTLLATGGDAARERALVLIDEAAGRYDAIGMPRHAQITRALRP